MNHDMTVIVNGEHTIDRGIQALRIPPVTIAGERYETHYIPGRSEPYLERTGELEMLTVPVEFYYKNEEPERAAEFLQSARTLEFGRMPGWLYNCQVLDRIEIPRGIIKTWNKFTVRFLCYPLMRESYPIELTSHSGELWIGRNLGNVSAQPTITLVVPEEDTVTVRLSSEYGDAAEFELRGIPAGEYIVSSELGGVCDTAGVNRTQYLWGDFPVISWGGNTFIEASVDDFTVRPNWRRR